MNESRRKKVAFVCVCVNKGELLIFCKVELGLTVCFEKICLLVSPSATRRPPPTLLPPHTDPADPSDLPPLPDLITVLEIITRQYVCY